VLALDPRTVDAVWTAVQGHLPLRPPHPPAGLPPASYLRPGLLHRHPGPAGHRLLLGRGSPPHPCRGNHPRGRRTEWLKAGVFDKLLAEALAAYDRIIGLDLSEVAVDGSLQKAPGGGQGTGPSPTDRGKIGWKWSVATDTVGVPIGWVIDGANRNDSVLLEPTLQAVASRGLLTDVQTLHLDKGYDSHLTIERCHNLGVTDIVCAKRQPKVTAGRKRGKTPQAQNRPHDRDPDPEQRRANETDQERNQDQEVTHPRAALARRTHKLLVLQLRPTAPQHRPIHYPTPRPDRPRRHPHPDRQTHQMGKTMERVTPIARVPKWSRP
jgi:Transposase DDE domain